MKTNIAVEMEIDAHSEVQAVQRFDVRLSDMLMDVEDGRCSDYSRIVRLEVGGCTYPIEVGE